MHARTAAQRNHGRCSASVVANPQPVVPACPARPTSSRRCALCPELLECFVLLPLLLLLVVLLECSAGLVDSCHETPLQGGCD